MAVVTFKWKNYLLHYIRYTKIIETVNDEVSNAWLVLDVENKEDKNNNLTNTRKIALFAVLVTTVRDQQKPG